ncbi:MAG TPA: beta-galactosidase GalA [Bryobacteraceae bacterium]|jgi:beta-galactosidase
MFQLTRRDLIKGGIAVAGVSPATPQTNTTTRSNEAPGPPPPGRERLLLDFGWRFHLGNADKAAEDFNLGTNAETFAKSGNLGGSIKPAAANYDDSGWTKVDLPHDWAVDLPFHEDKPLTAHGSKPLGRNYPDTSIGWYRRVFDLPASDRGRRLRLDFDGVFRDAMVIFNGHYLGENFSGYAPFDFDVTDFANFGAKNVILVRVDATLNEGWFYEGAGIYRHVWLNKLHPVHVPLWGTFVRSDVRDGAATVRITTQVRNSSDADASCHIGSTIMDAAGNAIASTQPAPVPAGAWQTIEAEHTLEVRNPALWSPESPNLYKLLTTVEVGGIAVDSYETEFGIRTVRFDAAQGFFLNGKRVKIKGTCNHQDHAGVGAALPDRIQYYRIERLKEMGSNAYRTSHNPPTPELLDACDRLGMLVLDETRMMSSTPEGLSQLDRLIRRDRNHPSVIMWSLGNEEPEQGSDRGVRIVTTMKRDARRLDPTRLATVAQNNAWGRGISSVVDVFGCNYHDKDVDSYHRDHPQQPMIGTETASTVSTRGIYANDKEKGYVSAYDVNYPPWATTAENWWSIYNSRTFLAGGFAWTGFDYRGEPTPYGWPCINSHFGIMDVCGFPKDNFFYYQAWWGSKSVLHLFPHWNWPGKEGQEIEVWVHSNLDRVELFLNGKSVGSQNVTRDRHLAWKVKYEPGTLEARGFKAGSEPLVVKRETTGEAASIVLHPDRDHVNADGEDVSMVAVQIVDAKGRGVPVADNEITFRITGNGRLIGVGNGDPSSHESDKADKRRAFNGLCMAILQASKQPGELTVEAASPGLKGASVTISCRPAKARPTV